MAFKTFAPGVLTSSDVNTFLMRQSVIVCTSATRPASPNEGMTIYETDTNVSFIYDGTNWRELSNFLAGQWESWTPVFQGTGWTWNLATTNAGFMRVGRTVIATGNVTLAAGCAAGSGRAEMTLPIQPVNPATTVPLGIFSVSDVSAGTEFSGIIGRTGSSPNIVGILSRQSTDGLNVALSGMTSTTISAGLNVPRDTDDRYWFNLTYQGVAP